MTLLSDEKIIAISAECFDLLTDNLGRLTTTISMYEIRDFARAIEAAVLEAQEKQEPFPFSAKRVTYHKAAPVVQPDTVLVPREPK